MGVIMSFDNAVSLRDAIVQARAEEKGEGQLRARLLVRKEGEGFTAHPYAKKVSHSEREEDVREYLDFLDELTGGSFFAEAIERRDSRSVAFQGLLRSGQHSSRRRWLGRDVRGGEGHNVLGLVRALRESIASYVTEVIEGRGR